MSRADRRAFERKQHKLVAKFPDKLTRIQIEQWTCKSPPKNLVDVWQSNHFLVQIYAENNGVFRLSVCRVQLDGLRWKDGISWEELQQIKKEVGMGDKFAVEIYPADADIVNVANMRNLWILPEAPAFAWRRSCLLEN